MTLLEEEGLTKNTIVIFTSDNGPWLPTGISGGSAGLLREGKGTTWEGGMREPGIFWSPGTIKPKLVTDMGTTMDLFNTFSILAGVSIPNDREMDGVDLSPILFGNGNSPRNEVFYYKGPELYAVRVGSFKAHLVTEAGYKPNTREEHNPPLLFNIDEDPSEQYNIAEKHPEEITKIMQVINLVNDH